MPPLTGVRVVDLTVAGAGPWAAMLLGLLGADVVKIESPEGDMARGVPPHQRGMSTLYLTANLNKRNAILDLKDERQRDLAVRLATASDVFVENFRPGVAARLGLGYPALAERNPSLVYASLSAYGQTGPMSGLAGNDPQVQAFCGWCSVNGAPGGQPEMFRYVAFIDLIAAVQLVEGILMALYARTRTGRGQKVELSMLEAALSLQTTRLAAYFATGEAPRPLGSACAHAVPHQAFRGQDGRYFAAGVLRDGDWPAFCRIIGRPDWANDPVLTSNAGRVAARAWLAPELEAIFARLPVAWWLRQFEKAGLPAGPFLDFEVLRDHPHVRANGWILALATPWGATHVQGPPWQFGSGPLPVRPNPAPGEHTAEIAAALGWTGGALHGPDQRVFDHRKVGI